MNERQREIPKPRSLSDAQWAEVRRAHEQNYFRYVFCSIQYVWGVLAMLGGASLYHLFHSGGQPVLAFHAALRNGALDGVVIFALIVMIRRSIDWIGMRRTARTAGL